MAKLLPVDTAPRDFSPSPITDAEAAPMFRAAINLFRLWRLTDEQAATPPHPPLRSHPPWESGGPGRLGRDGQASIAYIMGIKKAPRLVFRGTPRGYIRMSAATPVLSRSSGEARPA